jgi:hypothetical protein
MVGGVRAEAGADPGSRAAQYRSGWMGFGGFFLFGSCQVFSLPLLCSVILK